MKLKFLILTLVAVLLLSTKAGFSLVKTESILISGKIDVTEVDPKAEVTVDIYRYSLEPLGKSYAETFKATVDSTGSFNIPVKTPDSLFFMDIRYESSSRNIYLFEGRNLLLLGNKQDLEVRINDKGFDFGTNNSAMLNYQQEMAALKRESISCVDIDSACYAFARNSLYRLIAKRKEVRDRYRNKMSPFVHGLIYQHWYFQQIAGTFNSIMLGTLNTDEKLKTDAFKAFHYLISDSIMHGNGVVSRLSTKYIKCLYSKIRLDLASKYQISYRKIPGQELLRIIKSEYSGELRDQLLTYYYLTYMNNAGDTNPTVFTSEILETIQNGFYKSIILSVKEKRYPGKPAYPFILPDTAGRIHTLDGLRGKVLVMEFWFYGCGPCKILSRNMKPIVRYFEEEKDVVFIEVNVDRDINAWKKGLASGEYSSPEALHLYTGGQGDNHEIMKHYRFYGCPQLLIIDRNGKIISSNPLRPDSAVNAQLFIDLINEGLTKDK